MGGQILQKPIVTDPRVMTSWNPGTAIRVAFLLLEHLTSRGDVELVKKPSYS